MLWRIVQGYCWCLWYLLTPIGNEMLSHIGASLAALFTVAMLCAVWREGLPHD